MPTVSDVRLRSSLLGGTILDCVLGGGWAYNRVSNIVGDKSTGKTLLAIEACANFARLNPRSRIVYAECEASFDEDYAERLGLPLDRVDFPEDLDTVEDLFEDLESRLDTPSRLMYVIDSLDAISDRAEQGRKIDQGTYGTKSKQVVRALPSSEQETGEVEDHAHGRLSGARQRGSFLWGVSEAQWWQSARLLRVPCTVVGAGEEAEKDPKGRCAGYRYPGQGPV